ncbi:ECF transporter ATPase [Melissococcus plutonius DAT561]|nr:ECF transporter ATPase [Melissococcus plutonius DAT561]
MQPIIELKNISFSYQPEDTPILKNISFSIKKRRMDCNCWT